MVCFHAGSLTSRPFAESIANPTEVEWNGALRHPAGTGWYSSAMALERWPALPYDAWHDTYATLHMWMQVVGKVAHAQAPPLNHSWASALQVSTRGLRTGVLPHGNRSFTIEFDFV